MALKSSNKKGKRFYKVLSVFLLIIILASLSWFIYGPFWKINKVDVLNAKHTDVNLLKADLDSFLKQRSLFIIPNDHIILLSKKKIENYILNKYPSVEEVSVDKTFDKEIIIKIKDRKATGVWCDQKCFFFDDEGILFKKSFDFTGAIFAVWSIKEDTKSLNFYDKVPCLNMCVEEDFVSFLSNNKVKKVLIDGENLFMNTEYGFDIKALNNATTTMRNMNFFLNKYEESLNVLDYVDIRFMDKIFYKMR